MDLAAQVVTDRQFDQLTQAAWDVRNNYGRDIPDETETPDLAEPRDKLLRVPATETSAFQEQIVRRILQNDLS